ncbi:hypothetical protein [Solidesulfovibrio sp. C21]|uniref:hypothetical protein n=1 Tax=Solidesulfovibrio sp. C21 TaxID=3398613 RepID=UPI0039FD99A4
MQEKTPPTTPFVLHVGVTGHRELAAAAIPAITRAATDILDAIRLSVAAHYAHAPKGLFSTCPPILRCLSPLAEGADRIMARQALELGYELQAPLPFPRQEYEKDFKEDASKQEFRELLKKTTAVLELDGTRAAEDDAYLAAGRIVLEQSDLIIAVWNGAEAKGRGGTGQIAAEAQSRGIPMFVVNPVDPATVKLLATNVLDQWHTDLDEALGHILLPASCQIRPPAASHCERFVDFLIGGTPTGTSPQEYFAETWSRPNLLGGFPAWFEKTLARQKRPGASGAPPPASDRCPWCNGLGQNLPQPGQITRTLDEHYKWADHLAIHYGSRFRALGLLRHLLMAMVIIGLLIGFNVEPLEVLGFSLQFLGFAAILLLVRINRRGDWHQRFLDYRYMGEHLRHMPYLVLLGRVPAFAHEGADASCTKESWPAWHLRNVARQAGLVHARMEPSSLQQYCKLLDSNVIADQINFYAERRQRYDTISRRLEQFGTGCYIAGLLFILLRVAVFAWIKEVTPLWDGAMGSTLRRPLSEIALVIPAVASMTFAIRSQGEYIRLGMRYKRMLEMLEQKHKALQRLAPLTSAKLGDFAEDLAGLLSSEVSGWHVLVKSKVLSPY